MRQLCLRFNLFLCLFLAVATVSAGELPTASPEEVGLSPGKLARLDSVMQKFIDDEQTGGIIVMIARKGKVAHFKTFGMQDREEGKPMQKNSILRFYSMTKPIVSTAIMMLYEEGKLGLDDPVSKFIPEFKNLKVFKEASNGELMTEDAKREMTVRDLLRHTAGLTYGIFGQTPVDQRYVAANVLDHNSSLQKMAAKLGKLPLLYEPGDKWHYSVSVDVQGHLIEVITGKGLDEFLQERIFTPLDMKDTEFYVPDEKLDRFATNYGPTPDGDGLRPIDVPTRSRYRTKPKMLSGGGGLVSTARDYMRFCQMMLNKGELDGKRILKPETVKMMTTNQLPQGVSIALSAGERTGIGFGLGFSVVAGATPGGSMVPVGEFGWGGAASTHFWISPKHDMAAIVLTQYMPFSLRLELAAKPIIYSAIEE